MRFFLALALCISTAQAQTKTCATLADLSWLLGAWSAGGEKHTTLEVWQQASDKTYEGTGTTLANGSAAVITTEALRLVKMNAGIYYIAKVDHNPLPVAFRLIQCSHAHAVFENAKHDFPNRIHYQLISNNALKVGVTGNNNDGFELLFKKK